jgi:predicted hydrocarbon binding protein
MSGQGKIVWDADHGFINLIADSGRERLFLIRGGFIKAFADEIVKVSGEKMLTMIVRSLMKKLGAEVEDRPSWESFERFTDDTILTVSKEESEVPEIFSWDMKTRNLQLKGGGMYDIWTVKSIQAFKEVMADILTERGANAILHDVAKAGGKAVSDGIMESWGWKDVKSALDSLDGVNRFIYPNAGWGKSRALAGIGDDGFAIGIFKYWDLYESHGMKSQAPSCTISRSFIEGIGDGTGKAISDQSAEVREVKCIANGDEYCAFVVKFKPDKSPPLDWKELEDEWRALDAVDLPPE